MPVTRLITAISQPTKLPPHMATTIFSSVGTKSTGSPCHQVWMAGISWPSSMATATQKTKSTVSEV